MFMRPRNCWKGWLREGLPSAVIEVFSGYVDESETFQTPDCHGRLILRDSFFFAPDPVDIHSIAASRALRDDVCKTDAFGHIERSGCGALGVLPWSGLFDQRQSHVRKSSEQLPRVRISSSWSECAGAMKDRIQGIPESRG